VLKNSPKNIKANALINGSAFNRYLPIYHLGIQTLPGTQFYVNGGNNSIIIGNTGIYELDLEGLSEITALKFTKESITAIENTDGAYIIIDIIYEDMEV
jgi:hypothetical protein